MNAPPAVIGASTGDWARSHIQNALRIRGVDGFISTSLGRTTHDAGFGTDEAHGTALEVVDKAKAAGADCFVLEYGATEAAEARGDRRLLATNIEAMLEKIGPEYRVDWITPATGREKGFWSNDKMQMFTEELDRAAEGWKNLDVNHWERVPVDSPDWYYRDRIHLVGGNATRGAYAVDSAFIDGSR